MDAAEGYITAAIPEPFTILGLRLRPFCLGHYFLMRRFGVDFIADDSCNASIDDLVFGCLICSNTYEGFLELLNSGELPKEVEKWGAKIGLDFDLGDKVQLFNKYLEGAFRQPVVIYEGKTSTSGAHWSQIIKCALISPCGYSMSEALNLPLAQAFADFYKNAESNGVLTIADQETAALLKGDTWQ